MKLGNSIRRCRFDNNEMSQEDLANAVGVTRQTIHSIEKGKFIPSTLLAFKIAGLQAFRQGFMEAKPVLLEPIYNIEVIVPDDFTGDVMGDISSRRGNHNTSYTNARMHRKVYYKASHFIRPR